MRSSGDRMPADREFDDDVPAWRPHYLYAGRRESRHAQRPSAQGHRCLRGGRMSVYDQRSTLAVHARAVGAKQRKFESRLPQRRDLRRSEWRAAGAGDYDSVVTIRQHGELFCMHITRMLIPALMVAMLVPAANGQLGELQK